MKSSVFKHLEIGKCLRHCPDRFFPGIKIYQIEHLSQIKYKNIVVANVVALLARKLFKTLVTATASYDFFLPKTKTIVDTQYTTIESSINLL